jgi:hypothetical protein
MTISTCRHRLSKLRPCVSPGRAGPGGAMACVREDAAPYAARTFPGSRFRIHARTHARTHKHNTHMYTHARTHARTQHARARAHTHTHTHTFASDGAYHAGPTAGRLAFQE